MKLVLKGHNQKYALEQSLLALFPEERPVYGEAEPADRRVATVTLTEDAEEVTVETELRYDGKTGRSRCGCPLSGDNYAREGQRRHALGLSFFGAARDALGLTPPWGSLTGVRPTKVAQALLDEGGRTHAMRELQETYFVTPTRCQLVLEAAEAGQHAASLLTPDNISLYVGIPFCPTRCTYCSFVSQSVEKSLSMIAPYLNALCGEIVEAGQMLAGTGLRVRSFYMGGGTPTTLAARDLDRLLTVLERSFDFSNLAEMTVEAGRPDTITPEKLSVLTDHNVTRLSVNPQSMNDAVLAAIGRKHTADDIRVAMSMVRRAGFAHVNMDLIAGLPKDTPASFAHSLDECLALGADNITIHTLSLKNGSSISTGETMERLPSAKAVGEMLDYADGKLRTHGYVPYYLYRQKYMSGSFENVGWALPGSEGLYNIYIMEELHGILALGAGGSTKMVGKNKIERVFNAKYPQEYIQRPEKRRANLAAFRRFYSDQLKDRGYGGK